MANQNDNKIESKLTIMTESFKPLLKGIESAGSKSNDSNAAQQPQQPQQPNTNNSNQDSKDSSK